MIESLFPEGVVTVEATPDMWEAVLLPEEEVCVARAAPKRRREFAAGRACARRALADLGLPAQPLPAGPDRLPLWPAGAVGSITHCDGLAAAAVAWSDLFAGLGLDVERAEPLDPDLIPMVATSEEVERAARELVVPQAVAAKVLFCAKEASYKAWYPLSRRLLDFHDVEVVLEGRGGRFQAIFPGPPGRRAGPSRILRGRAVVSGRFVGAAVALRGAADHPARQGREPSGPPAGLDPVS